MKYFASFLVHWDASLLLSERIVDALGLSHSRDSDEMHSQVEGKPTTSASTQNRDLPKEPEIVRNQGMVETRFVILERAIYPASSY